MTVVNVTNGTLKGSVKGPTFTGDVDGATFTGSVTYTDTTEPPIEPPVDNTKGRITEFNAANSSRIKIDGATASVQNGNKSWSLKNPDPYTLRFEVHSGDQWVSSGGYADPTTAERSEIEMSTRYPPNVVVKADWGFTLEGSRSTSSWCVLGQIHQTVAGGSPPFAFELYNDKLSVMIRDNPSVERRVWTDSASAARGRRIEMRAEMKFASNGYCRVWRDGTQIVNFSGAIGFGSNEQYYWKQGVYRREAPETLVASYHNLWVRQG